MEVSRQREMTLEEVDALCSFPVNDCKIIGAQMIEALDRVWKNIEGESPMEEIIAQISEEQKKED